MLWDTIQGQKEAVTFLRQAVDKDKVVNAYLFRGPAGVGKSLTAGLFARALNCEKGGGEICGDCPSCRAIESNSHPDVLTLTPTGKSRSITIDQVRRMQRAAHLHPQRGGWKVFIIEEAETMNENAQNSLLKTLEEPPGKTVLLLTASRPESLMPTIRSRCQAINFKPWPFEIMEPFLRERAGLGKEEAYVLHSISGGRPGRALKATEKGFFRTRKLVMDTLKEGKFSSAEELVARVRAWLDDLEEKSRELSRELERRRADSEQDFSPAQLKAWRERDEAELAAEERSFLEMVFELSFSWFRDLFVFQQTGQRDQIINRDLMEEITSSSRDWEPAQLRRMMDWIERSRKTAFTTSGKATHQLVLENLFIQLGYWRMPA